MSVKITFRQKGTGPVLIMLHGYGGSVLHWDGVVEHLQKQFTVVVPNLTHIYMGTEKLLFTSQSEIIAKFIKNNFPDRIVNIAGISFGAAMAWAISLNHPGLIENIVLINPVMPDPIEKFRLMEMKYFFKVPLNITAAQLLLATPIGKAFLARSAKIFRDEDELHLERIQRLHGKKLHFVAYMLTHFIWLLKSEDWIVWQNRLKEIIHPICLIYDKEDLLFTHKSYLDFAEMLNPQEKHELVGAGHTAIKSRPSKIAQIMSGFLGRKKT